MTVALLPGGSEFRMPAADLHAMEKRVAKLAGTAGSSAPALAAEELTVEELSNEELAVENIDIESSIMMATDMTD